MDQEKTLILCHLKETYLSFKRSINLGVKHGQKYSNQMELGSKQVSLTIYDKIGLKLKLIGRYRDTSF